MSNMPRGRQPSPAEVATNERLAAQKTEYDRFSYILAALEQEIMINTLYRAVHEEAEPDEEYEDPQQKQQAIQAIRDADPDKYYSREEISKLNVPCTREDRRTANQVSKAAAEYLAQKGKSSTTLEQDNAVYFQLGMFTADVALELGECYEKWLKTLPDNEPDREEKARILTLYDRDSKAGIKLTGTKELLQTFGRMAGFYNPAPKRQNSFLKDCEALKHMTMGEFCNKALMDPRQAAAFYQGAKEKGTPCDAHTNAYSYFLAICKKENKNQPINDEKVAETAFSTYQRTITNYYTTLGRDYVIANMSPEQQKKAKIGTMLYQSTSLEPPKKLIDYIEEAKEKSRENRAEQMNDVYADVKKTVECTGNLDVTQQGFLASSLSPRASENPFDRYIQKHCGIQAIQDTPEKRREHLSKAIAASALKDNGKPFSVGTIHRWAKQIEAMGPFIDMADVDVVKGLFNKNTLDNARVDITKKLFGIPKERQASYLREMKGLARTMIPENGSSEAYQTLVKSVRAIGNMDPQDKNLEMKLIAANEKVMNAIKNYSKGKKSVRGSRDGQYKFDNCMDALSIVNNHVPGMHGEAKKLVDRTNEVRKAKVDDDNFVDLSRYGSGRAKAASDLRNPDTKKQEPNIMY